MKKIDLIALDLDGTALNPQNQVSPATADAVRRARESGIHVVVSTGRICGEARDFALMLGTDDQMVTSGGATLSSVSQERCTMRMSMPWEAAVRASAVVERIGMITMVYVGETLLITPYDDIEFGKYKSNEGYLSAKKLCRLLRNILPLTTFRSIKCSSAVRTRSCSCAPVRSWNRFRVSA